MGDRYVCIHGHFYQPPRENPWLEEIELQDSAYPYHDWNERITAECYEPNSTSRILDPEKWIVNIANNYAKISFNFGPTLLGWLKEKAPQVYGAILEADRESQKQFSGHGSALAQAYNHMILPLANRRDKRAQIIWGIRDFEHRFDRTPEGMWLPETAVDLETLDILAELGIRFTILAPYQASRVRRLGARSWRDVSGGRIDPTMAYELRLPSGRRIVLFFYDGPIARAIAFEGLLSNGEEMGRRLVGAFSEERAWPQLVHVATDGETYGHHHRFGDMGLAYALHWIESSQLARLTNYGEYLEKHPPTHLVEIFENTSWSCFHGIDRWRRDCGCNSGMRSGRSQGWREPLRTSLDWLRDRLSELYEKKAPELLKDPWKAREDYIGMILDRSEENSEGFWRRQAFGDLNREEKVLALRLLELQRHAMLMYTSCGWFFDELSGIETVQVIQYAGRAVQLAQEIFGDGLEAEFLQRLEQAKSNIAEHGDGGRIYEKFVKPAMVDWEKVAAHYGISSLFEDYPEKTRMYSYIAERQKYEVLQAGKAKLAVGQVHLTSEITRESAVLSFGVLHFGDHNVNGGVRKFLGPEAYDALLQDVSEPFLRGDIPEVIRIMDREFGESNYSVRALFRDEQRKIIDIILGSTLDEAELLFQQFYGNHAPMMRFLADLRIPLPRAFHGAAQFVLNADLRRALDGEELNNERIQELLQRADQEGVAIDNATLEYTLRKNLERLAELFASQPDDLAVLEKLTRAAIVKEGLPFVVDLYRVQNSYFKILQSAYPDLALKARRERGDAEAWVARFKTLGQILRVRVE